MKGNGQTDHLDHLLREALTVDADEKPSVRVMAAVMSQVRREAEARQARAGQRAALLAALLAAGVILAWAGVQLSLAFWPGLANFLSLPAENALFSLVWWVLERAAATLLLLAYYGLEHLLPLLLLGGLAAAPLALRSARRTAS